MLFLVVVTVFSRAAALIYAPSFLVLFHDFITPLGAFSFLSQLRLPCPRRVELTVQEGPIKPKHLVNVL